MKKIFFILLKKWTTNEVQANKNLVRPQYYPRDFTEPMYTVENLKDEPAAVKYLKKYRSR